MSTAKQHVQPVDQLRLSASIILLFVEAAVLLVSLLWMRLLISHVHSFFCFELYAAVVLKLVIRRLTTFLWGRVVSPALGCRRG